MIPPNSSSILSQNPSEHKPHTVVAWQTLNGCTSVPYNADIATVLKTFVSAMPDNLQSVSFVQYSEADAKRLGINALCPICQNPHNQEMLSACDNCLNKLKDCPECNSDDISFDWHVDKNNLHVIEWSCECNSCGYVAVSDEDSVADMYRDWQSEAVSNG